MKRISNIISPLIIGCSIVISSFIFSNLSNAEDNKQQLGYHYSPDVMSISQLSEYIHISEESIENIIKKDNFQKAELVGVGYSSYDTYQFIPYIKLENQTIFIKEEIDEWLKYQSMHN